MADTKFVYTVSGINLSDAQIAKISHEIAMAVTRAIVGDHPEAMRTEFFTVNRVYGGKMADTATAARTPDFVSTGCGGGTTAE